MGLSKYKSVVKLKSTDQIELNNCKAVELELQNSTNIV